MKWRWLGILNTFNTFVKQFGSQGVTPTLDNHLLIVSDWTVMQVKHKQVLEEIYQNSNASQAVWQYSYLPTLTNLALYLQDFPASQNHHHCYKGGFLDHAFEVINIALKKRNALMLPRGVTVEQQNNKKDIWSYAVFIASAMHDIGKINSDLIIKLYDKEQTLLGRWNPWSGDMHTLGACYYDYSYNTKRNYKTHTLIAPTMLTHIVSVASLDYLKSDDELFNNVLLAILGRYAESGDIGDIIKEADGQSAALSFANTNTQDTHHAAPASLADKLLSAIRFVVLEKQQTKAINEPGAIALTTKDFAYLFVKRVLDDVRDELTKHQQGGIPFKNPRLMDELTDFNIIDKNNDKAIFNIVVFGGGFKKKQNFAMIRMPLSRLYLDQTKAPKPFTGTIQEASDKEPTNATQESELLQDDNTQEPPKPQQEEVPKSQQEISKPKPQQEEPKPKPQQEKKPKSKPQQEETSKPTKAPHMPHKLKEIPSKECARLFLEWLSKGLIEGTLATNNQNACIHILNEGLFIVSPAIFRLYAGEDWERVQNGLTALKIAKKNPYDTNIWKIIVRPEYHHNQTAPARKISGYLIDDYQDKLKVAELSINQKMKLL